MLIGELTGAFMGGKWLPKGRRRTFIIGIIIVLAGAILRQIESYPVYCFSTFLCFFGAGLVQVTSPRYIEEVVPINLYGFFMAMNMLSQNFAVFIGQLLAIILPPDDDYEALEANESYRFIVSSCGIFALISAVMVFTCVKHETVKFHIIRDEKEKALDIIKLYSENGDPDAVYGKLEREMHRVKKEISMTEAAYKDPQYLRSTWIAQGLVFLIFMQGWYVITIDANLIFEKMYDENDPGGITERTATFTFVGCTVLGSFASLWIVGWVGRKNGLVLGSLFNTIILGFATFMLYLGQSLVASILIFLFSFSYTALCNSLFMAHIAETNPDVIIGFSFVIAAISIILLTIAAIPLLENLGSAPFFLFFTVFALISTVYNQVYLIESKNLTDKEKKKLYWPKKKKITDEDVAEEENYETKLAVSEEFEQSNDADGDDGAAKTQ